MEKKKFTKIQYSRGSQVKKPLKSARPKNKSTNKTTTSKKSTPENRLSDLENTLDLNIQILKTFYQSSKSVESLLTNQTSIVDAIDNIKKKYLKKKELFNIIKENKSKSLIEIQIYFEKKRKLEEMKELYLDKVKENEEGLNSKEEVIKKVQKRLKEVEVYIHKLTLNMLDRKRQKYYQDFTIVDFLDINNDLSKQKDLMNKKIEEIKKDLQATVNENKSYRIKNNEEKEKVNENENKTNEQEEKLKKLTKKYENKIELETSRINLLKNALEKMNQQFHLFNINKIIKKSTKSINVNLDKEDDTKNNKNFFKKISVVKKGEERDSRKKRLDTEESTSGKNYEDKFNSFLDFSVLNNKEDENDISRDKFGTLKNSIWDLSAINIKDISFIEKKD